MKIRLTNLLAIALVAFYSSSCGMMGEEVARIPIDEVGYDVPAKKKETKISLKKGEEIAVWSDMDVSYEGEVHLTFMVEITKDGKVMETLNFSPFKKNITIGEKKLEVNGKVDWSFEGKNAEYEASEDGEYTFAGRLTGSNNETIEVRKSELILKK